MSRSWFFVPAPALRRLAAVFVVFAVLAASWSAGSPAGATDGYQPDATVVANVETYSKELTSGYDHVLRWMRVLKSFGAIEGMTVAEAQGYAAEHLAERWNPVVQELTNLQDAPG